MRRLLPQNKEELRRKPPTGGSNAGDAEGVEDAVDREIIGGILFEKITSDPPALTIFKMRS